MWQKNLIFFWVLGWTKQGLDDQESTIKHKFTQWLSLNQECAREHARTEPELATVDGDDSALFHFTVVQVQRVLQRNG